MEIRVWLCIGAVAFSLRILNAMNNMYNAQGVINGDNWLW